uniref:Coiled-coil domain-containing protein 25 n=1 Tax=Gallus gallus TaxID=9031 RepID=A0A8V0Y029_CHICK
MGAEGVLPDSFSVPDNLQWKLLERQPPKISEAYGMRPGGAAKQSCSPQEGVVPTVYTIYMGKDKYENEDLIKYGWPEDIWFHVDKLSSAHVYLRLHKGQTVDDIPKEVLIDCAHLVKANSIQGCKMNNVNVVYTPWTNLKKTADMDVGQIGFHRQKDVKMLTVEKKVNEILNRLEKTKVERFPDLAAEKEARDREERNEKKAQIQEMKRKEKEEMKKKKELEELRSYSSLMKAENMSSNQDGNDSDDFM